MIKNFYDVQRMLGILSIITKTGPSRKDSYLYKFLKFIGLLDKLPGSWTNSKSIEKLPWSSGTIDAPKSEPPSGFDGIWPQNPVLDERFAAPTLNLSREERQPHLKYNVTRYLGQVLSLTPIAAMRSIFGTRLAYLDNEKFNWMLTETSFAQYINPQLDPADKQVFKTFLTNDDISKFAKVDCAYMKQVDDTLPNIYVAATNTLMRANEEGNYKAVAIEIDNEIFTPTDGAAWELAQYFVFQGLQILHGLVLHPRLHFPADTINTISQMTLPKGHLLYKLIKPHTVFTLGLNEAVIHHKRSVFHNSQQEVYTPFPIKTDAIHDGLAIGFSGIEGNSSYIQYKFGSEIIGTHTMYGRYREQWFDHIHKFTKRITAKIKKGDIYVEKWADHIHKWLPCFPNGKEIFEEGKLAWATAIYIATVSVFHTADHYSYTEIPIKYIPLRLRQPGPHIKRPEKLDRKKLVSREDFFRHQLGNAMFFKPVVLASLDKIRYYFRDPELKQAEMEFIEGFKDIDQRWKSTTLPVSTKIPVSLQY